MNGAIDTLIEPTIEADPVLDSAPREEDRDHLACCRDFFSDGPLVALCGFAIDSERLVFSDHVCEECIAIAIARLRELGCLPDGADLSALPRICVRDGSACPVDTEADALDRKILGVD